MRSSTKSLATKILKFSVAGGLIFWMVNRGLLDLSVLGQLLTPLHVGVGLSLIFLNIFINNFRWSLLLASQKLPSSFLVTFPLSLVGLFFNFAVPGSVGGDLLKAFYVAQDHPGRRMVAATSVMMDRIIGLYSMVWLALLAMFFNLSKVWENLILRNIFISSLALVFVMTLVLGLEIFLFRA
ncbi:MAG: flippase-like domain-containing protein [Bdellovibrionales bacterium]|nr:flippase-like domain-containing protein [Bdellovibrionales bacterium]